MLKDLDIEIINYLSINNGGDIKELTGHFGIGRTSLLYRLSGLISKGLIINVKKEGVSHYFKAGNAVYKKYYEGEIEKLKSEYESLSSRLLLREEHKTGERLKLVFINYYDLMPKYRKELEKYYNIDDYSDKELYLTKSEFVYRAKDADVIVNNWALEVDKSILSLLPKLQYMHVSTVMHRYVDINALKKRKIHFSHISYEYRFVALLEFVLAQTFTLMRNVEVASSQFRSGVTEFRQFGGDQLRGRRAGILGTSVLNKELYLTLKGLGTEVFVYSDNKADDPAMWGLKQFNSLKEVVSNSDILYITHSEDRKFPPADKLDKTVLSLIKKPIYIVSIAKHKYIDTKLVRKLVYDGKIRGLALDYFGDLPKIKHISDSDISEIAFLPNVLITPDVAWYTKDAVEKMNKETADCLIAYAKGDYRHLVI
jgi:phosphoglycerate dehydrogenase-like enzyme